MINAVANIIGINRIISSSYSTEYQQLLDVALTAGYGIPTQAQQIKENTAIVEAKNNGIWSQLDVFYGMTTNINYATLNWKNPSQYQLTLVNSPTYSISLGFVGNGTTSYLSTNWQPSIGVNYTQNNAGIGAYTANDLNDTSILFGASNSANTSSVYLQPRTTNLIATRINQGTTTSAANTNSIGRYHLKRTASNANAAYKDGVLVVSGSINSLARVSSTMLLLARDGGGTVLNFSSRSIRTFWAGASLNGLEATWNTIIQNLYA